MLSMTGFSCSCVFADLFRGNGLCYMGCLPLYDEAEGDVQRSGCRIGFITCTRNCCFNPLADLCDRKYPNADSTVYGADLVFHLFIIALYVQRVCQTAQDAPIDYIYCVFAVVAIALLFGSDLAVYF